MSDDQLDVLTNQRVDISFGGKTYSVRRATLSDFARMQRFQKKKIEDHDDGSLEIDTALFILSDILKPNYDLTPEQLGEMIPFSELIELQQGLEKAGFTLPQAKTQE